MAIKITKPSIGGFTIIEVLIVLSLMAVLASIAVSDMNLLTTSKILKARDNFFIALNKARNLAINHNSPVSLCKSANMAKCTNQDGYEQGWIIFTDVDRDGKYDSGERKFSLSNLNLGSISIRGNNNFKNRVTFLPSGDSTTFGRFVLCHNSRLKTSEMIFINSTGKPRIAPDNNKNRIPEDYNNKDILSCLTATTILD